jgi:hypothetical protein
MKTIITNYKYFVETIDSYKRVESVLTKLQEAKPEEQKKDMIIVNYSEEGMCFFDIKSIIDGVRLVEFTGTGA